MTRDAHDPDQPGELRIVHSLVLGLACRHKTLVFYLNQDL